MYIKDNRGITLPVVLLALMLLVVFGITTLFMTSSQAKFNYRDDSSKKALEYAEAGYNDYLWHLNDDVNFYSTERHEKMMNTPIKYQEGYYMLEVSKPSDTDRFVTIKSTGWTNDNPDIKRTIVAKIRKKQFVHHVYVSNSDGENIWWTTGDECHGPYHTNGDLYIQKHPIFYDTVSYSGKLKKGTEYNPDFKVKEPKQPEFLEGGLEFPKSNSRLKEWAEKDDMVFYGRTCIYLDGDKIKIRNGNAKLEEIEVIPISNIKNKVIYVDNKENWKDNKFDLDAGNIFISGKLKGKLTIASANNIYITATDPTYWYDEEDKNHRNPPETYPKGSSKDGIPYGITYSNTTFSPENLSYWDENKGIWTRYAKGDDMLGLIAQNDIMILHYGWPRYMKGDEDYYNKPYWNYKWRKRIFGNWLKESFIYDVAPENITIHASLFAVNGGFGYEAYDVPDEYNWWGPIYTKKGNITLWGNITQWERKAVGTFDTNTGETLTGYKKRYAHDPRMFYDYPPHILEPINVGWEIHDWEEVDEHLIGK